MPYLHSQQLLLIWKCKECATYSFWGYNLEVQYVFGPKMVLLIIQTSNKFKIISRMAHTIQSLWLNPTLGDFEKPTFSSTLPTDNVTEEDCNDVSMLWFHLRCISHSQDWSRNLGLLPVPSPAKGTNRVSNSQMNITFRPAIRASAMCCGNTLYNTLFARSPLLLTLFAAIESCNQKNSIIQVISQ